MDRICVSDIKLGQQISSTYLVKSKRLGSFREREGHFMSLVLGDRTGEVQALLWEGAEDVYPGIAPGNLVLVSGLVREYSGALQINLDSISIYDGEDFDPADFLPVSPRNSEEMLQELQLIIDSVENPFLKKLLNLFFSDSRWVEAFKKAPAAKKNHQAYLGGLLEHTLKVSTLAAKIAEIYPHADRDLLIAGTILHDIGKLEEYQYRSTIDFTDEGRLLGHIVLGMRQVDGRINQIHDFPGNLRLKLLHIIASHHGRYEWQSPKRPKFLEAAIIHNLDLLDATVETFSSAVDETNDRNSSWTGWVRELERFIYTG